MSVAIHALVAPPGRLRIWVGVFDHPELVSLRWKVDGIPTDPIEPPIRVLSVIPHLAPGLVTQTGVYELPVPASPKHKFDVQAFATSSPRHLADGNPDCSNLLPTCPLPTVVPSGLNEWFNVLLVSCFAEHNDQCGFAGAAVERLRGTPDRPDLILLAGDQVYLDNPILERRDELSGTLHAKYRTNWTLTKGRGFAQILRMAPVASIPDDHEYWNNYPHPNALPAGWFTDPKKWHRIARALYDGFQLATPGAYTYSFDVSPLSFLMLDNRTSRCAETMTTMSKSDEAAFDSWVAHVAKERLVPVIVTGPSLFQDKATGGKQYLDRNFANYRDYPKVIQGLLSLSRQGLPYLALTGDVHYGRVIKLIDRRASVPVAFQPSYEVISSPSSLVDPPFVPDVESLLRGGSLLRQAFKKAKRPPDTFRPAGTPASIKTELLWPPKHPKSFELPWSPKAADFIETNHVALIKFRRIADGVDIRIRYLMIDPSRSPATYPDISAKISIMPNHTEEQAA